MGVGDGCAKREELGKGDAFSLGVPMQKLTLLRIMNNNNNEQIKGTS